MSAPLWEPSQAQIASSHMSAFTRLARERHDATIDNFDDLHRWSITQPAAFWSAVWSYCGVRASGCPDPVLEHGERFPGARWFGGARLNYAENLLRYRDERTALIALEESGRRQALSYAELYRQVERAAAALRRLGIRPGDRVAAVLPNIPEAVVAMLASASIGAVWSSCSPDFGLEGILDRFGQIEPRVLFVADGYRYGGRAIDCRPRTAELLDGLPSVQRAIVVPMLQGQPDPGTEGGHGRCQSYPAFLSEGEPVALRFAQLPFDHPLFILYSSGTTGAPKCIVHGAGGTLIQHLKEHQLHTDIHRRDVLFYFTTCGWMMWNWLVSGLASGCTVVLYDGSPMAGDGRRLLQAIDDEGITVFGTSAGYLGALRKAGAQPRPAFQLTSLRAVLSTGSPLSGECFRWVYQAFGPQLQLASISGGTDIISCFVLGNPNLPVFAGEIQGPGLGMAVDIFDEGGRPLRGARGELVCTRPFPSCPLGFWRDPGGQRFRRAYFERFPGVWAHGDYGEITPRGGFIIHGRSDATLNPGGVRIGTAEIYRQLETIDDVVDGVAIDQAWQGDTRIVVFVVLREGARLDDALQARIRDRIRTGASPRHVPARILQVRAVPRTLSGKIVELAVRELVHGRPIHNRHALANPEVLEEYRDRPELKV